MTIIIITVIDIKRNWRILVININSVIIIMYTLINMLALYAIEEYIGNNITIVTPIYTNILGLR